MNAINSDKILDQLKSKKEAELKGFNLTTFPHIRVTTQWDYPESPDKPKGL